MRDVVVYCNSAVNFLAEVNRRDKYKRERDFTFFHTRECAQYYQQENKSGSADYSGIKEEHIQKSARKRRCAHHYREIPASVMLLDYRPDKQQERYITREMLKSRVSENIREHSQVRQRVEEIWVTVTHEKQPV